MKKGDKKLLIFNIILIIFLLVNSFILNILSYIWLAVLLGVLLIVFKYLFGLEKDNHRYIKDIIFSILIVLLSSFILYYLFGLTISFVKTDNYYTVSGFGNYIIPIIIIACLKEYLRYQMICKCGKKKSLIILTTVTFILLDITVRFSIHDFATKFDTFMFIARILMPAISRNIACMYIARKVGYKPNIIWTLVVLLYSNLLPIVPNTGVYIGSMISFLYPAVIMYSSYGFFRRRDKNIPLQDERKKNYFTIPILIVIVAFIIYFTSGYFRYYTIAIATGSMTPNVLKGDVVVIDQEYPRENLKAGQVIAYKIEGIIVVHRLVDIIELDGEKFYYTQGDANNAVDNYTVKEEMILGVVEHKIPYIGLPTVWLNEL